MNRATKQIINEVAKETGLPIGRVELVIEMLYKHCKHIMENDCTKDIYIKYFGTFKYNEKLHKKLNDEKNS